TYTFHLNFTDSDGNYNDSSSSPDLSLTVTKAPTTTVASQTQTSITYGNTDTVSFTVSSLLGVSGQHATGTVSLTKTSGPSGGNLNCQDTEATPTSTPGLNATESSSGFTFTADSSNHPSLRLVCT